MSFLEKMETRYTTKKYNPEKAISKENIEQLKEILRLSPSSINSQPWKFVFVTDAKTKLKFSDISRHNKEKVINSNCLIIFQVIKDVKYFEEKILPEGSMNYYKTHIQQQGEAYIKAWLINQVYISLGILLAACADMKIDSTPMEGIEKDKYDEIVSDANYQTLFAVALGTRADDDINQPSIKPKSRLDERLVIRNL